MLTLILQEKKWTHYFWEFFMLFLAVSAGFLVENQREHYVEHQRAKKMLGGPIVKPRDSVLRLTNLPVNNKPGLMNQYTGWLKFESGIYKYQSDHYLTPLKKLAIELLTILKEEHHLK
jgi:hypothetical protein